MNVFWRTLLGACTIWSLNSMACSLAVAEETERLEFGNWTWPATAMVTQSTTKRGLKATIQYWLLAEKAEDGSVRVKLHGPRYVTFNGTSASRLFSSPQQQRQKEQQLERLISAEFQVSPSGELTNTRETDTTHNLEATRERWQIWVGAWVGWNLKSGASKAKTAPFQLGSLVVDSRVTLTHCGAKENGMHCLEIETTVDDATVAEQLREQLALEFGEDSHTGRKAMIKNFKFINKLQVVTDPQTLRPATASCSKTTVFQLDDQAYDEAEIVEFRFEWQQ